MTLKFWTWPAQIRALERRIKEAGDIRDALNQQLVSAMLTQSARKRDLSLARRALSCFRKQEGMDDAQIAAAFESLLENKGFEAILAIIFEEECAAMDRMSEDGADLAHMKKAAGAYDALTNLHARLIDLEEQARARAQRAKGKAA